MSRIALQMRGITKRFPGVKALDDVDFDLEAGEVHALVGANGAGKSTLVKIIQGLYSDYSGSVTIQGQEIRLRTPKISQQFGSG